MTAADSTASTTRPLTGLAIGISISEAEAPLLSNLGLTAADINQVTVELCRRLVSLGAQVVLGHQWRPGGVMEAVARFAQVYQPESRTPIIHNYLAFPDRAALSPQERQRLAPVVAIYDDDHEMPSRREALHQMRQRMTEACHARICLCGRLTQSEGYMPGVIEEVAMTLGGNRPVYLSGMMGGTTRLLTQFIRGQRDVFASLPAELNRLTLRWRESSEFQSSLRQLEEFDVARLAQTCGLEDRELHELFDAQNLDTVVHLTTRGLTTVLDRS
jgi:hypothetical protein